MNRTEFMEQLEKLLADIPQEERIEALSYYKGYFEDAGIENEERIIRELESPEKVAGMIQADIGMENEKESEDVEYQQAESKESEDEAIGYQQTETASAKGSTRHQNCEANADERTFKKEDKTLKIVLLVLLAVVTCPIWLGILAAIVGVLVGVAGVVLGIVLSLVMVVFALFVAGFVLAGVGIGMFPMGNLPAGIGLLGIGLLVLALAGLGMLLCVWLFGRILPYLVKATVKVCRNIWKRRGQTV